MPVCVRLQAVFRPGEVNLLFDRFEVAYIDPWFLMLGLCSVTLLMAVTAYLIVRLGKVWDDARLLVLVLLLMISTVFRDSFARRLQYVAAGGIGTICVVALLAGPRFGLPAESIGGYIGGMTVLTVAFGPAAPDHAAS